MGASKGNGKMASLREKILATRSGLKIAAVNVTGWDFPVWVKQLTAVAAEEWHAEVATSSIAAGSNEVQVQLHAQRAARRLVSLTLCDEDGALVCDGEADFDQLGELSNDAIQEIYAASAKLSGLTKGAVEEAGKASEATPAADSSSGLH